MSKWTVGAGDSRAVHEDGQYRGEMDSREQAARIVKLLNEGEALKVERDSLQRAMRVWRVLFSGAEVAERVARFNGPLDEVDATAAAPASKETAK